MCNEFSGTERTQSDCHDYRHDGVLFQSMQAGCIQTLSGISKALLQAGICCQRQLQLEERMPVGETINESA